jgi:hypothetical protein
VVEPQALQYAQTFLSVAQIVVQFEDCVPDLAKKVAIVLEEDQLGTLDIALQEIDRDFVPHERVHIHECDVDTSTGRNIDDGTFNMHG